MRRFLLPIAIASALIAITSIAVVSLSQTSQKTAFYGPHQAGIATPSQNFAIVVGFNIDTKTKSELVGLLKTWTELSEALSQGESLGEHSIKDLPPKDTGERLSFDPANTTLTFGVGPSFFDERFGLASKLPHALQPLPVFKGDAIEAPYVNTDLVVQVCSDDLQTAWHAVHALSRSSLGLAHVQFAQVGFLPSPKANKNPVGRNLQGFLDGTENPNPLKPEEFDEIVWVGDESDQAWIKGGSYLVFRKIKMFVEVWDRSSLGDQENSIGRDRLYGTEQSKMDPNSHVNLARGDKSQKIFRRPYSYLEGVSGKTGQWEAGLVFLAYQKNPLTQFVPMQIRISQSDLLNEYVRPIGSAVYAMFGGIKEGQIIGQSLIIGESIKGFADQSQIGLSSVLELLDKNDLASVPAALDTWIKDFESQAFIIGTPLPEIHEIIEDIEKLIEAEKVDAPVIKAKIVDLIKELKEWGEVGNQSINLAGLAPFKEIVAEIGEKLPSKDFKELGELNQELSEAWSKAEGIVRSKNSEAYTQSELAIANFSQSIKSNDIVLAQESQQSLKKILESVAGASGYSFWDAASLLFREGLEALLIIASLIAFLQKSNQAPRAKIVWSGVGSGVLLSAIIAVLVSSVLANISLGPTREGMEGIVGIVSVALMLTVGIWLHSKARIKDWNLYIKERLGKIANIAHPLPLFLLAFVAVFREGAETIIFFWGLAPNMELSQMLIGIGLASVVLIGLGLAMIKFSKRLPLQWFFPIATGLMYYLAIKVLGQSMAALQASGILQNHPIEGAPSIGFIGFSPSYEVLIAQLAVGIPLILLVVIPLLKKKPSKPA